MIGQTIGIADALAVLTPGAAWALTGNTYAGLTWLDPNIPKPSEQEVNDEIAVLTQNQPLNECKQKAQQLLDESDWATKTDVTDTSLHPHLVNAADFVAYRLTLRTLRINPEVDPIWPTPPTEVWSS